MKEHPDLLRIRAKVLSDEGKWEEAEKVLRRWILVDPEESESRYQLVQVLQRNGKKEAAEEEQKNYEKVMELRVRLNELTKVASLNPDDAEVRDELARVHDQLGGTTMAELWRQAAAAVRQNAGQKKQDEEKSGPGRDTKVGKD